MSDFVELFNHKIISIDKVNIKDNSVEAILTVSQFNRVTMKPYFFSFSDWLDVKERGYI